MVQCRNEYLLDNDGEVHGIVPSETLKYQNRIQAHQAAITHTSYRHIQHSKGGDHRVVPCSTGSDLRIALNLIDGDLRIVLGITGGDLRVMLDMIGGDL